MIIIADISYIVNAFSPHPAAQPFVLQIRHIHPPALEVPDGKKILFILSIVSSIANFLGLPGEIL